MSAFLLDTTTISATMWKEPSQRVLDRLRAYGPDCVIGAPVWHELRFGVSRMPRGRRKNAIEAYLNDVIRLTLPILPYDDRSAEWHASERARLERIGKPAPFVDGQIAAIAAVHALTLVTSNVADFKPFKGVTVVDWTRS